MNALKDYVEWKLTHSGVNAEAEGYPLILEECKKNKYMKEMKVYGNGMQGTTTENPDAVQSVGDRTKNLYDAKTYPMTDGWCVSNEDGKLYTSIKQCATESYIPCVDIRGLTVTISHTTGNATGIAFYDETQKYISGVGNYNKGDKITVTVPDEASYYRFSMSRDFMDVGQIEIGENVTGYEPYGKYKIPVVQSGKNLFKPTVVSCSAYTNINNATDNNSYGTEIDSTDLSDNIVKINQVYNDQYSSDNYRNGFITIGTDGNLKVNQSYVLSFDFEIPENSPRIPSYIVIITNGNSGYFKATLKKETRQRVNTVFKMNELRENFPQYIEIRCMGMSFTASNFMITEVGFDAEFEPYSEPITHNVFLEQPLADGEVLDVKEHIPLPKLTAKTTVFTTDTTTPPSKMYGKYIKR